jgi:hypothetical protein
MGLFEEVVWSVKKLQGTNKSEIRKPKSEKKRQKTNKKQK